MRIHTTILALAASALVAAACGGSDSTAPDLSHVGAYDLELIDGAPVPASIFSVPGYHLDVIAGQLTLNANNTFVESITVREIVDDVEGPIEAFNCLGSYQRRGATLTMTVPATPICDAATTTGRIDGNSVIVDYQGVEAVFRR